MFQFLSLLSLLQLSSANLPSYSYKALHYAAATYCSPNLINNWSCHFCKDEKKFKLQDGLVEDDQLAGYTGYDSGSKMIVLAFRGSANLNNAVRDANILPVSAPGIPGGILHKGFWNAYRDLMEPFLLERFRAVLDKYPGKPILVTGHSLGGAMAGIAALDIKENMSGYFTSSDANRKVYVRTFGAPRFGDRDVAEVFDSKLKQTSARFSNAYDFVCRLPSFWAGFRHVATQYYCDRNCNRGANVQKCDSGRDGVEPRNCNIRANRPRYDDHVIYLGINMACGAIENSQLPANPVEPMEPMEPLQPVVTPAVPLLTPAHWTILLAALVVANCVIFAFYAHSASTNRQLQQMLVKQ